MEGITQLYSILKASKLGAEAAPDMYTALFAQKINKGGSGGEAERSEQNQTVDEVSRKRLTGEEQARTSKTKGGGGNDRHRKSVE